MMVTEPARTRTEEKAAQSSPVKPASPGRGQREVSFDDQLDFTFYQQMDETQLPSSPLPPTPAAAWRNTAHQVSSDDSMSEVSEADNSKDEMDQEERSHVYHNEMTMRPSELSQSILERGQRPVTPPREVTKKRQAESPMSRPEVKRMETEGSKIVTRSKAAREDIEVPDLKYVWSPVGKESKCHHANKPVSAVCGVVWSRGDRNHEVRVLQPGGLEPLPGEGRDPRGDTLGRPGDGSGPDRHEQVHRRDVQGSRRHVGPEGTGRAIRPAVCAVVQRGAEDVGIHDGHVPATEQSGRTGRKVKGKKASSRMRLSQSFFFRFAMLALVSSLITGAAGFLLGHTHDPSQAEERLLANQKHLVQRLRDTEHRAALDHVALWNLTEVIHGEHLQTALKLKKARVGLLSLATVMAVHQRASAVAEGLEAMVIGHRLAPALVDIPVVRKKMDKLAGEAKKRGKRLSIASVHQLFQCQVSFASFKSGRVRIIVHIPVTGSEDRFTLYRYVPVPFKVNDSMVEVITDKDLLAVSDDKQRYFVMGHDELAHCDDFRSFWSCTERSAINKARAEDCLWAVFTANEKMAAKSCKMATLGAVSRMWRVSHLRVVLWQPVADTVVISCEGRAVRSRFAEGLIGIDLAPGCKAENSDFAMTSPHVLYEEFMVLERAAVRINASTWTHGEDWARLSEIQDGLSHTVHDPSLPQNVPDDLPFPSLGSAGMHWSVLITTFLVVVAMAMLLVGLSRRHWQRLGAEGAKKDAQKSRSVQVNLKTQGEQIVLE